MKFPAFVKSVAIGLARLAAANTARDGSGTIAIVLTGRGKKAPVTINTANDTVTVNNWSSLSAESIGYITNGDNVSFISGTPPGGTSNNTLYQITELVINSTADTATFKLLNSSNTVVDLTSVGTSPVMMLPGGTRVDTLYFTSAQLTAAASSGLVFRAFVYDAQNTVWRLVGEVAAPTVTASNTAVGSAVSISFNNGLALPEGWQLGVTQSIYAGVQDQTDVVARNAGHF